MRTRIISAIIALLLLVPIFILGGNIYKITIIIIALLGLKEFIDIKETKKNLPSFVKFIAYIIMTLLVVTKQLEISTYSVDLRIISGLFLTFLTPVIFYHDREKYSINDAFFMIGGLFFLGISFNLLMLMREISLALLIYLFLVTIFTDTYAFITGLLIGRHKLLESVSPKKTIEGLIGGTFFGVLFSATYYYVVINSNLSVFTLIFITTFLSIIGQFGDLVFSAIKRYYGKKDFSNIMPGHGGVLDRLDSIIFVLLAFMFFISII